VPVRCVHLVNRVRGAIDIEVEPVAEEVLMVGRVDAWRYG
jgi:hypothetical protein